MPSIHDICSSARLLLQHDRPADALRVLDVIPDTAHDAELYFLRGMARSRLGTRSSAINDFNAALALSPSNPAILFNRGLVHFALDACEEALDDFRCVSRIHPSASDAHANAGVLLLRMDRPTEAIPHLRDALEIVPGDFRILRSLGNALQAAGQGQEALHVLSACEKHANNDPAVLTDHGMALLANGHAIAAQARFRRALSVHPFDQTALAGLYLAANSVGDTTVVDQLMDHEKLLASSNSPASLDLSELRNATLEHLSLRWEPAGRSTRGGQQTMMLELADSSPFSSYKKFLELFVANRISEVRSNPYLADHPWARMAPKNWRIQSWATILHEGGHQTPHIHPAGWLSGVLYVDKGNDRDDFGGDLLFGHHPTMGLDAKPREHVHRPENGEVVSFPSYYFHHTRPYRGTRARISLAFDVVSLD